MTQHALNLAGKMAPLDLVIVDNDEIVLEIVSRIMFKTATSYRMFFDTDEAMSYLSQTQPAPRILVIDYYMPTISGVEFLAQLSSSVDLANSSVYLCSAVEPRENHIEQLHRLGGRVIDKSLIFDRKSLLELVASQQHDTGN